MLKEEATAMIWAQAERLNPYFNGTCSKRNLMQPLRVVNVS